MLIKTFYAALLGVILYACASTSEHTRITSEQTADYHLIQMWSGEEVWRAHLDPNGEPLLQYADEDGVFRDMQRVRALSPEEIAGMLQHLEALEARGRAIQQAMQGLGSIE